MKSIIEIHKNGAWVEAAELNYSDTNHLTFNYLPFYQFSDNPSPVSLAIPVKNEIYNIENTTNPAFIYDLVPQGIGRKYLLQNLKVNDSEAMHIPLAQIGAFNPIGNIRLDTAVNYFNHWVEGQAFPVSEGFTKKQIIDKNENFVNHIWLHAMLTTGTTGVQGAAPKFLMTQNADGLWFADSALPDELARKHWLIKLPRGKSTDDNNVLRIEAIYHKIAKDSGLRVEGECHVENNMLFFERFDRKVELNAQDGLIKTFRLHQESIISVAGIPGFPSGVSLFIYADAVAKVATDPAAELTEFIKRELLNRAMGNTDNHGRNTAFQVTLAGVVRLTPLYDFAPMFMDPEMIPRSCRWLLDKREVQNLTEIVDHINTTDAVKHIVLTNIQAFYEFLDNLPAVMKRNGLDQSVIDRLKYNIEAAKDVIRG